MTILEQPISELTETELYDAFQEILEWHKTGVLQDGVIRKVHEKYENQIGKSYALWLLERDFLWEITKRHYGIG